jgi:hypothetical protein
LISRQEHEAWNVLLACQGQLRLAPSGHVVGIDIGAALRLAATRGCDLAAVSELVPTAEAGLVEALGTKTRRSWPAPTSVKHGSPLMGHASQRLRA